MSDLLLRKSIKIEDNELMIAKLQKLWQLYKPNKGKNKTRKYVHSAQHPSNMSWTIMKNNPVLSRA